MTLSLLGKIIAMISIATMGTFLTILPIFLIIALGYGLRARNVVKANWVKPLNTYVYNVGLPALIVYSFTTLQWREVLAGQLLSLQIVIVVVTAILVAILIRLLPTKTNYQAAIYLAVVLGNTVYLGIPLVSSALPGVVTTDVTSITTAIGVVQLVCSVLVALIGLEYVFLGTRDVRFVSKHIITNPLTLSILVGLVFALIGWPHWLDRSIGVPLKMLAGTASPLALFALGSFLYGHKINRKQARLGLAVGLKLAFVPLIAWAVMVAAQIYSTERNITVLMAAMPTAVTAFVLADTYELDTTFVASVMMVSTILSVVAVPVIANLLQL